ncbi:MAG: hypothetical protein Q4C95_10715 [Planctomycetia bacterium]|nr:hypothetical protein [Planctomycetia bacterium]
MRTFIIISILGLLSVFESNLLYAQFNNDYYQGTIAPITNNLPKPQATQTTQATKVTQAPFHTEAVLFARNDYQELNDLAGTDQDALLLITGFLKKSGTKNSQISLLCDSPKTFEDDKINPPSDKLRIQAPTRENLIKELNRVADIPCNRLVVAIGCHGASAHGKSYIVSQGGSEEEGIFDNVPPNNIVEEIKKQNLVALDEILDILNNAKALQVLVLLDACRSNYSPQESESGRSAASGGRNSFMREFNDRLKSNQYVTKSVSGSNSQQQSNTSIAIITSCSYGQEAEETRDGNNNGLFTKAFVEGLGGNADCLGCLDCSVSLTEAYNYAASEVKKNSTKGQMPEIFYDGQDDFQNIDLIRYNNLADPDVADDDLTFLLKSAYVFLHKKTTEPKEFEAGVEAVDCFLDNVPNNKMAYTLRGTGHRMLKNYEQSIKDLSTVGQNLQLFAKQTDETKPIILKNGEEELDVNIEKQDLLTIADVNGNWLLVTEINNIPLEKQGYIHRSIVDWDPEAAGNIIVGSPMQGTRTVRPSSSRYSNGGMVSSGLDNPRPFNYVPSSITGFGH